MEMKPMIHAPVVAPAQYIPAAPIAPVMQLPHDHIHLHASYKHTAIVLPEPVAHVPVAPPVAPWTSTASILVLFILLVIIAHGLRC